jgi:hypothetical protein
LPAERRARLQALIRKSGGRPTNLSTSERREVRKLLAELNLADMAREIAQLASSRRRRRGR